MAPGPPGPTSTLPLPPLLDPISFLTRHHQERISTEVPSCEFSGLETLVVPTIFWPPLLFYVILMKAVLQISGKESDISEDCIALLWYIVCNSQPISRSS